MGDVRLAALAHLPVVHPLGDDVGAADQGGVATAVDPAVRADQPGNGVGALAHTDKSRYNSVCQFFNVT
jgi:hypothetical protein